MDPCGGILLGAGAKIGSSDDFALSDPSCPNEKLDEGDVALLADDELMGMPPIALLEDGDELGLDSRFEEPAPYASRAGSGASGRSPESEAFESEPPVDCPTCPATPKPAALDEAPPSGPDEVGPEPLGALMSAPASLGPPPRNCPPASEPLGGVPMPACAGPDFGNCPPAPEALAEMPMPT
jgi:hypothetical protein